MKKTLFLCTLSLLGVATANISANASLPQNPAITWSNPNGSGQITPSVASIIGGPWVLYGNVQGSGSAAQNYQSQNYCVSGNQTSNTSITPVPMQPFYFPFVVGQGLNLQGYFDYRPKDTNEAVVAAYSTDGGLTWNFQQKALELNPGLCPTAISNSNAESYPGEQNNVITYNTVTSIGTPATTTKSAQSLTTTGLGQSGDCSLADPLYPSYNQSLLISTSCGSPGATDAGQGHPYVTSIVVNGKATTFLYTLDRSTNTGDNLYLSDNSDDNLGLVVHTLTPTTGVPLNGAEATSPDVCPDKTYQTTQPNCPHNPVNGTPVINNVKRTTGLIAPDGILAEVPGSNPRIVLYVSVILNNDAIPTNSTTLEYPSTNVVNDAIAVVDENPYGLSNLSSLLSAAGTVNNAGVPPLSYVGSPTATTAGPGQCSVAPSGTPTSGSINNNFVTVRLAKTSDGVNFTDLGAVNGLNDPTTTSYYGTRYIAPRGTLFQIPGTSRYGLIFAGGNCLDADSDSFHYIGYAESNDLINWTIFNDINHPIASIQPETVKSNVPGSTFGNSITIPSNTPLISYLDANGKWNSGAGTISGTTQANSAFYQRVYGPNLIPLSKNSDGTYNYTLIFTGYNTQKPNKNLSNYRTIIQSVLKATINPSAN